MKNKTFIIYLATNTVNGNRYIGATSRGLERRKNQHLWDANRKRPGCRVLNAAIRKYGGEIFEWEIIATLSSFNEMMDEEVRLIAEMKPEYNITRGGQGIVGVPRTAEWLAKMSKALKGRKPPQKCYDSRPVDLNFKSVVCLNDGMFFKSIKYAASHYGIGKRGITEMLKGRQIAVGGLSFAYSNVELTVDKRNEFLDGLQERRQRNEERLSSGAARNRSVTCLTDGKQYRGGAEAARAYGISQMRISQLCNNGGATQSGLMFKFSDQEHAPVKRERTEQEIKAAREANLAALKRGQEKIKKRVILVESGEIYESIADAAKKNRIPEKEIYYHIDKGTSHSLTGFTFRKLDKAGNQIIVKDTSSYKVRKILCINDMIVYDGLLHASRSIGIGRGLLKTACDKNKEVSGHQFCYLDEWCGNPL